MIRIQPPSISDKFECPYIPGRYAKYMYFFATSLNEIELNGLLENGWRKFGYYYFKPSCGDCRECVPIRILADDFSTSKNLRRVYNQNRDLEVKFGKLEYSDEIYRLYCCHSSGRFNSESTREEFIFNFYNPSCPSLQSEYYLDDKLVAVGYLDITFEAASSVYFFYELGLSRRSPGTFSILREIEFCKNNNLKYYYLGYYVKDNHFMAYKARFKRQERYDWENNAWVGYEI